MTNMSKIYAEDVPYFQTSQSAADTWMDKAKTEIRGIGGKVVSEAFGADGDGRAAFMLVFSIASEQYKIVWPVLPSRSGNDKAAKVQAATALYHDVKARVVSAKFQGIRGAFMGYLLLPNGQTATEATSADFVMLMPTMMLGSGSGS